MLPDIIPYPNVSKKEANQTYGHYGHNFHVKYHLEFPQYTPMKEDTHTHISYNGYTWTLIMVTPKSKVGTQCRTNSMIKSES